MRRPNVLFIITDQHRADHVGFMGNLTMCNPIHNTKFYDSDTAS